MPDHVCTETQRLKNIEAICKRLDDSLRGNGKPGLFTQFAVLKATVGGLLGLNILIVTGLITLWFKG